MDPFGLRAKIGAIVVAIADIYDKLAKVNTVVSAVVEKTHSLGLSYETIKLHLDNLGLGDKLKSVEELKAEIAVVRAEITKAKELLESLKGGEKSFGELTPQDWKILKNPFFVVPAILALLFGLRRKKAANAG